MSHAASIRNAAVLALASLVGTAPGQNLLENPGFESGLSPWTGIGSTLELLSSEPYAGAFAARATVRNSWTSGHLGVINGSHTSGTVLLFTGAMRLDGPSPDKGQVKIRYEFGPGDTQSFLIARRSAAQGEWFTLRGIHPFSYTGAQPDIKLLLQTRDGNEDFSADAFGVEVYEEDPNWLATANAGIEQHRRRDLEVHVTNVFGKPLGGTLAVDQVRHRFAFGATIEGTELEDNNQPYMAMFPTLFEWATPRNDLKWRQTEATRDHLTWTRADLSVGFCQSHGIQIYGHNIFWASVDHAPDWVPGLNDTQLMGEMTERLDDLVGRFGDAIDHWDVNNEMLHASYYQDRFGPSIRDWMFEQTALRDPGATLMLNDYSVVGGGLLGGEGESYFDQALDFLSRGVPIGGLGAQCHFDTRPIIARWLRDRLDVLAGVGLPIRLTEFDVTRADSNERADELEKFYRVAFSHPAVDGITLWGWWAGNHGNGPDAAIVDQNFAINAAGQRYLDLLSEWTTHAAMPTGRHGFITLRGYHGTYDTNFTAAGYDADLGSFEVEPGEGTQTVSLVAVGTCPADIDANGVVDFFDTIGFLKLHDAGDMRTDLDGSGDMNAEDITLFLNLAGNGCP
ncbi:MAG: endo-1,4-beta-xylanase [Phycisphaeraceae bacterium]|nr:MAG: endo-1,4-beta-xylanase [Phycisphaeraceae bacterium]